jgi:WD40 repeat protein
LQTPEGREALCRLAMQPEQTLAREIAVAADYAPGEGGQRALFYFLTEQWERYESLDFDQALLRVVYQAGDEELRRRIAATARQVGRVEWVAVVTGGRQKRRLGEMTDAEWQVTVEVLQGRGQWSELWQLAREAPPPWAARMLRHLKEASWRPREPTGFDNLARLAEGWQEPDLGALVRPCGVLSEHTGPVTALAFCPDGQVLANGGNDGKVRLWGLPDGRLLRTLNDHPGGVTCLAIHPDGRTLVTGGHDGMLWLWGLPDGRALGLLEQAHAPRSLALRPDGRLLASGLGDWKGTVQLWDFPEGRPRARLEGHNGAVSSLAISPDGQWLVSGGEDSRVCVWELPDGNFRQMLRTRDWVAALAITPDNRTLASAGYDRAVRLWKLPTGEPLAKLEGHTGDVTCLAMSPDGRVLASGSHDKDVRLWGLPEGRTLHRLHHTTGAVSCVAISPYGRLLAVGGNDGLVRLWSLMPLRLTHAPLGRLNLHDLAWVQETLKDEALPPAERAALEFVAALIRWRMQFEIELGEAPRRVSAGEFDIEIAG